MQRSLVAEDLSNGAETFKLRVVNQYNDDEEAVPAEFEYITAVDQGVAIAQKEAGEPPKPAPDEECKCESTCTFACHYDEPNNILRACKTQCACNTHATPCKVACFTRPSTRFQVFYTPNKGWSLQTLEDIKTGQALFEYVGILSMDQGKKLDNDDYIFAFRYGSNRYMLNAHLKGNLARFVNHSCRPNCCPMLVESASAGTIPRVLIYSLREIYAGEELVMDYGEDWWLAKAETVRGGCCCMSEECDYDEDWCDNIVEKYGKGKGRSRQYAFKSPPSPAGYGRARQLTATARKCPGTPTPSIRRKPRPQVATMEPKELDDLLANEYEYGEAEDDAEDEEEEDKMEPPPEKKQHMGTNGTAADGNK